MTLFIIYLLVTLPVIGEVMTAIGTIGGLVVFGVYLISFLPPTFKDDVEVRKNVSPYRWIFLAIFIVGILIPSERQLGYILAGHIITNAENVDKLPDNISKTLNSLLENLNATVKANQPHYVEE